MRIPRFLLPLVIGTSGIAFSADEGYEEPALTEADRNHWAYQPLPENPDPALSIDSFLKKSLTDAGIPGFAPPADDATLLRRLHVILTGLPPTVDEVKSFRAETDFEKTLDELLASPHYGERWAQHWLDLARFAETDGFEHDKVRAESWRYRDWVIAAFNRDLSYDRFVAHQIAGDEWEPDSDAVLGTGFLFAGPDMPDINLETERRHTVLNELTTAVGSAFLGITIGCAQCHDHKDDPFSQADFYRLRAFFDNARLPAKNKSLPHFFSESGATVSGESLLRIRGDFRRAGPELRPAFVRVLNVPSENSREIFPSPREKSSGRRSVLARWMIDPQRNPVLPRVVVNRVWQHHFGTGLVTTPNDFGVLGTPPSHPELLDWLAADFVKNGWSLKKLHRNIITSRAWQQTSLPAPDNELRKRIDPDNRLLSRRVPLRLSGETIRDCMLAASGHLNPKSGGPGFRPPLPQEVTVTLLKNQWPVTGDKTEHDRRSVYLFARRNLRYPLFDAFDRPDANLSCARRHVSTTAPQSLILLNSAFSESCADRLAAAIQGVPGGEKAKPAEAQIVDAYLRTIARVPSAEEIQLAKAFIGTESVEAFCLALMNQNEFVFLD